MNAHAWQGIPRSMISLALLFALAAMASADSAVDPAKPDVSQTGMLGTASGEQVYAQICQGCHMSNGRGAEGAGRYPAFAKSPAVASSRYLAVTILNGRRNMPAFARPEKQEFYFEPVWLTDLQVANVINYIRGNFGNDYRDAITAAEVQALRPTNQGD